MAKGQEMGRDLSRRGYIANMLPQKSIGYFRHSELSAGLDGLILKSFCKGLGWDPERVRVFSMEVRKDIRRRDVHMMSTL